MYHPYELFVGLRYTRAKRRNHFISFSSIISILGVFLGVSALIIVLSVMNGFEREVRERILSMIAHITVIDYVQEKNSWKTITKTAMEHPNVVGAAPYIQREGMLIHRNNVAGAVFRGIKPELEAKVSKIADNMRDGQLSNLKAGEFGILLGSSLATRLGVIPGDKITMVTPSANVTPAGVLPRLKRFTVKGIFEVGFYEYDSGVGLIHIDDAARVFRMKNKITGVQIQTDNIFNVHNVQRELLQTKLGEYNIRDWSYYHSNWFKAVKMEKTMMFLLLSLIIIVAAINIVSTMVMVVTEKESDIAIMRTYGASTSSIMKVFVIQGSIYGIIGTLLGAAFGIFTAFNLESMIAWLERKAGHEFIDGSVYMISNLPSDPSWEQVTYICIASLIITILATIFPAWRASRIQPAEALRYE